MDKVLTPDGWGQVLRTQSAHGRTSYLVEGVGFSGWYDGLQVTADFADHPDDVIPNPDNETTLPYPSAPQGPGWDGTTSTIPPDVDPDLDMGCASDSLTGEVTGEDPVEADIEGLFEPPSRLAGVRPRRVHFATLDDSILDVSALPEESPTGLENSPLNPDSVDTDDLFDGSQPHFERSSSYDRLVIEDHLAFMRYASEDEDEKKHHREQGPSYPKDSDDDDGDGSSPSGASDDSSSSDSDGDGGSSDGGGGSHTASYALTTTADLHFLANFCVCAEELPLHSKLEHRELVAEGKLSDRRKKNKPLGSKPLTGHHGDHDPKTPTEAGYSAKGAKGVGEVVKKKKRGKKPFSGTTKQSGADEVRAQEVDLPKLLERYEQENFHFQESNLGDLVDRSEDDEDNADLYNHYASVQHDSGHGGVHAPYRIREIGGRWYVVNDRGERKEASGYATQDEARQHQKALYANVPNAAEMAEREEKREKKTAAPAEAPQPTQIESQIEQLMQFWAVDNNGWWHWTGSQADLALLNQMQQQMMAVGMPGGPPGQMQAQSAVHTANPAMLAPLLEGAVAGEAGAAAGGTASRLMGALPGMGGGGMSPAGMLTGAADALAEFNGGTDLSVTRDVPFQNYAFVLESNTPAPWREYLQTIASDKLVALAAWRDVVEKSKRLRSEGAINLEVFKPEVITAFVQGDHGRYYTTVQRLGSVAPGVGRQLTSTQVSGWSCECDWGHWAWLRKRSFVGRMCSHAYALFSEMRSLDAKARRNKGKPLTPGKFASAGKEFWIRTAGGFEWVSEDPALPTAAITRTASGWSARVWSDGTTEDFLYLGNFGHSKYALRAVARTINGHLKLAEEGDVDVVGGAFEPYDAPDSISGEGDFDPYSEDGTPEALIPEERQQGSSGIQESTTRVGSFSVFAEEDDGQDDEGPEETDTGIEEEEDPEDEESLDEEVAEDEAETSDGGEDEDPASDDDGGRDEPHQREDDDEGTVNPGDESDDEGIEKQSVAQLQEQYGLINLAGANYSLTEQDTMVREGEGKTARNRSDLNLAGTHYESQTKTGGSEAEEVLAFLF